MVHCQLLALKCRSSWAVFRSEVPQLPAEWVGGKKRTQPQRPGAVPALPTSHHTAMAPPHRATTGVHKRGRRTLLWPTGASGCLWV